MAVILYKVLETHPDRISGGFTRFNYKPYLPKPSRVGKWLPFCKQVAICRSGWHVTPFPFQWGARRYSSLGVKARTFVVEARGEVRYRLNWKTGRNNISKSCWQQIRLLYEVEYRGHQWVRKYPLYTRGD